MYGFDPELKRQLEALKKQTQLQHNAPSDEWPIVFVEQANAVLIIRERANGELTAFLMPRR